MKNFAGWLLLTVLACACAARGFAQGMSPDGGASARFAKLLGGERAFTATAVMTMKDKSGDGDSTMEMAFATLAGKVRTEIDVAKASLAGAGDDAREQMTAMGMNCVVSIVRPDLNKTFLVYPGLKAYCEVMPAGKAQLPAQTPHFEKQELGRETLDGHPCVKQQVTVTETGSPAFTALVWEAIDLNGFPIQTRMTNAKGEVTTRFKNIRNEPPAAVLFDPPSGFQRYGSLQEMMMGAMQKKMLGG